MAQIGKHKKIGVRRSILELQRDYETGKPELMKPLEDLIRAWKGIQELEPGDPRSFFNLAGFHGEPFSGAGYGDGSYWGGYCNHGNVLFPTWHRLHVLSVEQALQSIKGCEDVMLPYWDETDHFSLANGIPSILTDEKFMLDGKEINNPLHAFVLPAKLTDSVAADQGLYTKPAKYKTVRYPLSGLVGTDAARKQSEAHNADYPYPVALEKLNGNVKAWLNQKEIKIPPGEGGQKAQIKPADVAQKFRDCLDAPNYTVFSNLTSAGKYNDTTGNELTVVPLESPHNSIHLALGGNDTPNYDASPIPGANGDMGENNTAAFDPIFFFHHCNVDRVFWLWQVRHNSTEELEIIHKYPGTNSSDSQGATPGTPPNSWLTLDSPLDPFYHADGRLFTSREVVNIEKMGYKYSHGSLEDTPKKELKLTAGYEPMKLAISKINRGGIKGSFTISAYLSVDGKEYYMGSEAILSRWNVGGCKNCQTHLEAKAFFNLHTLPVTLIQKARDEKNRYKFVVRLDGKDGNDSVFQNFKVNNEKDKPYHMEIF